MPHKEHNPYQLPLLFEPRRDSITYTVPAGTFTDAGSRESSIGRFVQEIHDPIPVRMPADAANYLMQRVYVPFAECTQEELHVLLLNSQNHLRYHSMVYRGTVNQINVRMAELFHDAVRFNVPSFILAHNHPSSDPEPSIHDIRLTERAVEASSLLDVTLLDHLIIGEGCFVSLKERRLGFP